MSVSLINHLRSASVTQNALRPQSLRSGPNPHTFLKFDAKDDKGTEFRWWRQAAAEVGSARAAPRKTLQKLNEDNTISQQNGLNECRFSIGGNSA
jgi:hypothetical protein